MLSTEALQTAVNALVYPSTETREAYKQGVQEYRTAQAALIEEWKAWLADEYEVPGLPSKRQTDVIFGKAWENGHSSGYHEIENEYIGLTDFLRAYLKD